MYSYDFLGMNGTVINLSRIQVRNVIEDSSRIVSADFLHYVQNYHDFISKISVDIEFEYEYKHLDFRMRVKQKDSILNKLLHYQYDKKELGKVSLNKCLNDLLGFRIILQNFDHDNNGLLNLCDIMKKDNYKVACINSSKDKYTATHIYFYGKNSFFPWELQLWHTSDAQQNEYSHKEHKSKRDYINWPQMYMLSKEHEEKRGGE